jgi:hypothetical protein
MILFGMEVPTAYLEKVEPYLDIHFVIASYLLKDKVYKDYYKERVNKSTTPVFLDNGMYEENKPIEGEQLLDLALELDVSTVMAPDQHPFFKETLKLSDSFLTLCVKKNFPLHRVCLIPQGETVEEVVKCWASMQYWGAFPIGLSFLNDRREVLKQGGFLIEDNRWYHCLGLYDLCEIRDWPPEIKSMDTIKPFKAAMQKKTMLTMKRGTGKWNTKWKLESFEQELLLYKNIRLLKEVLNWRHM